MWNRRLAFLLAAAVVAAGALFRCGSVPLTAPAGSTIFAQVNPPFVIANGGTAVVTAMVTMPNGMLVPDGTVVYFYTDLGRVDESVETRNGVAHANFISDSRSGTANVTIWSGGQPAANPTPAPTGTPGTNGFEAPSGAVAKAAAGGRRVMPAGAGGPVGVSFDTKVGSVTLTIDIGSALPKQIVVTATPDRITNPRRATIVANVYDGNGNPVQHVPVTFSAALGSGNPTGTGFEETLASGGAPQYTDSNGQAFDVLSTRALNGTSQKTVTVTATVISGTGGASGTVLTGTVNVVIDFMPPAAGWGR